MARLLTVIAICIVTSGCAVGVTHKYESAGLKFGYQTNSSVAVAVQDRRPSVLNSEKEPNFAGLSRGGFGNPFDVTTDSTRPLADDFADTIVAALKSDGVIATAISVSPRDGAASVRKTLLAARADRFVLMTLIDWRADTYANTALNYDVTLRVLDASGNQRAEKRLAGKDDLGGDFINPPGHSRRVVPVAFRRKLEELFRDPSITAAMR